MIQYLKYREASTEVYFLLNIVDLIQLLLYYLYFFNTKNYRLLSKGIRTTSKTFSYLFLLKKDCDTPKTMLYTHSESLETVFLKTAG